MPVDNSADAEISQRAGFVNRDEDKRNNYVRGGGGTLIRIIEYGPDHPRYTHRTETVDYVVILSGEIDLELDNNEVLHFRPGDTFVNRGGMHTWINRGRNPVVMAEILIDATPVQVGGQVLHTHYPD